MNSGPYTAQIQRALIALLSGNNTWTGTNTFVTPPVGAGTVTSVSVVTANGVSGSVATATTTPAITLALGDITPTSVTLNSNAILLGEASNTFAQRNGTSAQMFRVYNTYTDASNYERGLYGYSSNVLTIGHDKAGTGVQRAVRFVSAGTSFVELTTASKVLLYRDLIFNFDNSNDIGASAANRPRTLYAGTSVVVPTVNATSAYQANGTPGTASATFTTTDGKTVTVTSGIITSVV